MKLKPKIKHMNIFTNNMPRKGLFYGRKKNELV
jgi:hypothetical protein